MLIDRYKFFLSQPIPQVILTTILDRMKWKSKPTPPPTPPKKVEDEAAQKPKRAIFPGLIGGKGGGINFQSLLSKILYCGRVMNFALHCVGFFSLWLSQTKEVLGFKN